MSLTLISLIIASALAGKSFYVDPNSTSAEYFQQPTATWFSDANADIKSAVSDVVDSAQAANQVPVLVLYTIPQRDCGSYSSGGAASDDAYKTFVQQFAKGIGSAETVVILEPDSLGVLDCLDRDGKLARYALLKYAVERLKQKPNTHVYIDAGHPDWVDANTMVKRLKKSGLGEADGFALNVSNFYSNKSNLIYGKAISALTHHSHFVIDTSRNGNGISDPYEWCNPPGMALGTSPTPITHHKLLDAFLWIKPPGESDGTCNGGPSAGTWWQDYATGLAS